MGLLIVWEGFCSYCVKKKTTTKQNRRKCPEMPFRLSQRDHSIRVCCSHQSHFGIKVALCASTNLLLPTFCDNLLNMPYSISASVQKKVRNIRPIFQVQKWSYLLVKGNTCVLCVRVNLTLIMITLSTDIIRIIIGIVTGAVWLAGRRLTLTGRQLEKAYCSQSSVIGSGTRSSPSFIHL